MATPLPIIRLPAPAKELTLKRGIALKAVMTAAKRNTFEGDPKSTMSIKYNEIPKPAPVKSGP